MSLFKNKRPKIRDIADTNNADALFGYLVYLGVFATIGIACWILNGFASLFN